MNLHGMAYGAIGTVNPMIKATILKSAGYTIGADYSQVPTFTSVTGYIQMQGLAEREFATLDHVDQMNMNGVIRKIYAFGNLSMVIRTLGTGGDLIQTGAAPNVLTWKLVRVYEAWPDWCSVVVRQQLDTP